MYGVDLKIYLIFLFGIIGLFFDSDICGRNMCKYSGGFSIFMDYVEEESEEVLI